MNAISLNNEKLKKSNEKVNQVNLKLNNYYNDRLVKLQRSKNERFEKKKFFYDKIMDINREVIGQSIQNVNLKNDKKKQQIINTVDINLFNK